MSRGLKGIEQGVLTLDESPSTLKRRTHTHKQRGGEHATAQKRHTPHMQPHPAL